MNHDMTRTIVVLIALAPAGMGALISPPETAPPAPPAITPPVMKVEAPALADDKPRDYRGLHNVVAYHEGYYSGSVPEGEAGFDDLAALGVKTIITVDGAEPDLTAARARGIRYIHLPIGYNGFDDTRKLELVRASRDSIDDGAVYIHCHHGKHRSAGAAGTVAVSLGWLTPEKAVERMTISGAAPDYKGLYSCTSNATVVDAKIIDAIPANFPEISKPASFVKSMVEIDEINDRLKLIEKAGWMVPTDHPDLVPVAETGRMADMFRFAAQTDKARSHPEGFVSALSEGLRRLTALEELLAAEKKDSKKLSEQFKFIQASCKDCHAKHRD